MGRARSEACSRCQVVESQALVSWRKPPINSLSLSVSSASLQFKFGVTVGLLLAAPAAAQKAPEAAYVFPPGGRAGSTVEVRLGGYDWTPDLQYFVHEPRVKLEITGSLSPIFVPPPPYWFGPKSFLVGPPLPRELPARLTLPADLPPGPVRWQVAGASGPSATGVFLVTGPDEGAEVLEDPHEQRGPQSLPALPVVVSGRLSRIEEVDRYRFTAPKDGPISLDLMARRLGSNFNGILEVRDAEGRLVADDADTEGRDARLTFAAKGGAEYIASLHDVDFKGDRALVYRLTVRPGPRVLAAIPAAGRQGETRAVRFLGIGVATGAAKLERVTREVTFPSAHDARELAYRLETPFGNAAPVTLTVTDLPEAVEADTATGTSHQFAAPGAVTGTLERRGGEDRYVCALNAGETWSLAAGARKYGSPLDVALVVYGPDGKELARNDDLPGTTDASLEFTAPSDGAYSIAVADGGGTGGSELAVYRLSAERTRPGYSLEVAQTLAVPLDKGAELTVKALRTGGFKGAIALEVAGLPEGYSAPTPLAIPEGTGELKVPIQCAPDAAALASLVTIRGTATVDGQEMRRIATAPASGNLSPLDPQENAAPLVLVAGTLKPKWVVSPVDKDGGRTIHRGTTYPAELTIERKEGFDGPIRLEMAARQDRIRQGITGPDLVVPPGVSRFAYPCFMPQWLETSRTSRMTLVASAQLKDPRGNLRWLVVDGDGRITMSIEGALLKVSQSLGEMTLAPGGSFEVPVKVSRSAKLPEMVRVELQVPEELAGMVTAEPVMMAPDQESATLRVTTTANDRLLGDQTLTIRAVAMQNGTLPVVSQTTVPVRFADR